MSKRKRRPFFDVPGWIGWDGITRHTDSLRQTAKKIFIPMPPETIETFEEATIRLNLTAEDIEKRSVSLRRLRCIFLGFSALIFGYACYELWTASVWLGCVIFAITGIPLAQAFRYDFWYFQIKNRKLGCSLKEWFLTRFRHDKAGLQIHEHEKKDN